MRRRATHLGEIGERRNAVEPYPEARELRRRGEDAAEDEAQGKAEISDIPAVFRRVVEGDDHVGERAREEEEHPDEEEAPNVDVVAAGEGRKAVWEGQHEAPTSRLSTVTTTTHPAFL